MFWQAGVEFWFWWGIFFPRAFGTHRKWLSARPTTKLKVPASTWITVDSKNSQGIFVGSLLNFCPKEASIYIKIITKSYALIPSLFYSQITETRHEKKVMSDMDAIYE